MQSTFATIEESLAKIEESLDHKKTGKNSQMDIIAKELKKVKIQINNTKESFTDEQKKIIQNQENKIKTIMEKIKPIVLLKPQEKNSTRQEILTVLKNIQKRVAALNEKKDNKKDNKKRQTSIDFFKFHQSKLLTLSEWLLSPSRKFSMQNMKLLTKYLNDLHISQDDSVFQEELKELYEKIIFFAEEPLEITHELFMESFSSKARINDYLLSKQTKENTYRNSICPNYKMIDLSVISKMPKEVLFFMFYIHKAETEQYLAAKELMRRSWRYYIKFHMWIKRGNHPNFDTTEEYETGNYFTMGTELIIRERKGIKINHKHLITKLGN